MDVPGAWVYRVAVNLANSHFRRQALLRRLQPRLRAELLHHDPDLGDAVAVRQALAVLKPRTRMAIVLRYYLDYSVAQTAQTMGIPQNTVKTLVRRGLGQMQRALTDATDTEGVAHA